MSMTLSGGTTLLAVADGCNYQVQVYNSGSGWTTYGSNGTGPGRFLQPQDACFDPSGNLYVADWTGQAVQEYNGGWTIISGTTQFSSSGVWNVASDSGGNIYVTDLGIPQKYVPGSPGTWTALSTYPGTQSAGLAVDSSGHLFVGDVNGRIYKFDGATWTTFAGGATGSANGQFNFAAAIAVDNSGNVFVADSGNNRVQELDSSGAYLTQFTALGGSGYLSAPEGVAVDNQGNVYVTTDNTVQKIVVFNYVP